MRKGKILETARLFALIVFVGLFLSQSYLSLERLNTFPQYYEVSGLAGYDSGMWIDQNSMSNGTVVVSNKPGDWLGTISNHKTIVEQWSPFSATPNVIADSVLGLFYALDNTQTLTREYTSGGSVSGQKLYVSAYNVWDEVFSIPDNYVFVIYLDENGKEVVISLSEISKESFWKQKSSNESQIVSEYSCNLFTLEKLVTLRSESPFVNLNWKFTARQDLEGVNLRIFSLMEPSLDFERAYIPGVLDWQNPWEKPSLVDTVQNWAKVECPPLVLKGNFSAILDSENGLLVVFEFANVPDWLNIGALGNRHIDAFRVGYQLGELSQDYSHEISFSALLYSFESVQIEQPTQADLKQLLDSKGNFTIHESDFLTYIKENNVELLVLDSQRLPSNVIFSEILDRIYDNGKFVIYSIRH